MLFGAYIEWLPRQRVKSFSMGFEVNAFSAKNDSEPTYYVGIKDQYKLNYIMLDVNMVGNYLLTIGKIKPFLEGGLTPKILLSNKSTVEHTSGNTLTQTLKVGIPTVPTYLLGGGARWNRLSLHARYSSSVGKTYTKQSYLFLKY